MTAVNAASPATLDTNSPSTTPYSDVNISIITDGTAYLINLPNVNLSDIRMRFNFNLSRNKCS